VRRRSVSRRHRTSGIAAIPNLPEGPGAAAEPLPPRPVPFRRRARRAESKKAAIEQARSARRSPVEPPWAGMIAGLALPRKDSVVSPNAPSTTMRMAPGIRSLCGMVPASWGSIFGWIFHLTTVSPNIAVGGRGADFGGSHRGWRSTPGLRARRVLRVHTGIAVRQDSHAPRWPQPCLESVIRGASATRSMQPGETRSASAAIS